MNKAVQQQKDLIFALADALEARAAGAHTDAERSLLQRARLSGWKSLAERMRRG